MLFSTSLASDKPLFKFRSDYKHLSIFVVVVVVISKHFGGYSWL